MEKLHLKKHSSMFIIFEKKLEMFYLLSIKEVSLVFTFLD